MVNMETTTEITKRHLEGKTLDEFAKSLGIGAVRQNIDHWKSGDHEPDIKTLIKVIGSPTATPEAKEWAQECLNILTGFDVNLSEPDLDKEIERRR